MIFECSNMVLGHLFQVPPSLNDNHPVKKPEVTKLLQPTLYYQITGPALLKIWINAETVLCRALLCFHIKYLLTKLEICYQIEPNGLNVQVHFRHQYCMVWK